MKTTIKYLSCMIFATLSFNISTSWAQNSTYATDYWDNWQENDVATFPTFNLQNSIEIDIDPRSQLRWSIDPATITLGDDRVVRYVIIGSSRSGTINALYEGILCAQGTYKTYARAIQSNQQAATAWRPVENPQWQALDSASLSGHQRILARLYMCNDSSMPNSINEIVRKLRDPYSSRSSSSH